MKVKFLAVFALTALFAMAVVDASTGQDKKATDEGKGVEFKSKKYEMAEKGEVSILLAFTAGKEVTVTTDGPKQTDIHLFVYTADKKEVVKDTSPGPKCEVKFTPKTDSKFNLVLHNAGPGANSVTLEVKVAK